MPNYEDVRERLASSTSGSVARAPWQRDHSARMVSGWRAPASYGSVAMTSAAPVGNFTQSSPLPARCPLYVQAAADEACGWCGRL